jgi:hypothetical protein
LLVAQTEWGAIPRSDLAMKQFDADTNASVVILSESCNTFMNNDVGLTSEYQYRIKILKERGYDWATSRVDLYSSNNGDWDIIKGIEGKTYMLDTNGVVHQQELNSHDVVRETVDAKHEVVRFTMPSLSPGCIIEYRYTISHPSIWSVPDWHFQGSEPVLWSEYKLSYPDHLAYSMIFSGSENLTINEEKDDINNYMGEAASYLHSNLSNTKHWHLALAHAPALRDEPFVKSMEDHRTQVRVQLSALARWEGGVENVLNTWNRFIDDLAEDKDFAGKIEAPKSVRLLTDDLIKNDTSETEKIHSIYHWLSHSLTCTDRDKIWRSPQSFDDILDNKKGSASDIAFLFISMLRYAGINAQPILLSTRNHGKVQELYPIVGQFNCVLVQGTLKNGQVLYFDATNPIRPMNILPSSVLGVKGIVIQKNRVQWVEIPSTTPSNVCPLPPMDRLTDIAKLNIKDLQTLKSGKESAQKKISIS